MTPLEDAPAVLDAKVTVYESKIVSGAAALAEVVAEIEESLSQAMTTEEWTASLRGIWPDMSESPELEQLYDKYNEYLALQHDFWDIRGFLSDEVRWNKYLD